MQQADFIKQRLNIPYVKLKFHIIFPEDVTVPMEKVSALRGGMGEMLLQQNCVADRDCGKCFFEEDCIVRRTMYTQMKIKPKFMQGNDSVGYLLECEDYRTEIQGGQGIFFYLTLFGKNIVYFSQYLQAFYRLGMHGIGKYKAKFYISEIRNQNGKVLLENNRVEMKNYQISHLYDYGKKRADKLKNAGCRNFITFHTPLCLKYEGQYLQEFDAEAVFRALFRRIMMLDYFVENYQDPEELSTYPAIVWQKSYLHSVSRYSSTKNAKVTLRGLKGSFQLEEIPEEVLIYLAAGEITHIGKNTSFGFGRYTVE